MALAGLLKPFYSLHRLKRCVQVGGQVPDGAFRATELAFCDRGTAKWGFQTSDSTGLHPPDEEELRMRTPKMNQVKG